MTSKFDTKITKVYNAIVNKVSALITTHNNNNSAHNDLFNGKASSTHDHGNLKNDGKVGASNNASMNVVTNASGYITTEAKPTIPSGSSTASDIKMNGTQSAGSSSNFAKADHVHPSDTSKANVGHTHGNITNDGKVGTASGKPLITTTDGAIITGSFGSNSGQFAEGNHTHSNYLTSHQNISGKEDLSNKVTTWSSPITNTNYPSEKLVKDNLDKIVQMIGDAFDINEATINVIWVGDGTKPEAIEVSLADSNGNNILMIQSGENTYQQVNYPWLMRNNHWTGAAIAVMGNDINVTSTDVPNYPNKTITIDEDYNINITYNSRGPKVPEEYEEPL